MAGLIPTIPDAFFHTQAPACALPLPRVLPSCQCNNALGTQSGGSCVLTTRCLRPREPTHTGIDIGNCAGCGTSESGCAAWGAGPCSVLRCLGVLGGARDR